MHAGNPVALYNVGVYYFSRKGGVELDLAKAAEYFSKAAQLGFAPAQVRMSPPPSQHKCVPALLVNASVSPPPTPQVNLGNMYYQGLGVEKDWTRAKELYRAAQGADKNAKVLLEELEQEEAKLHHSGDQDS